MKAIESTSANDTLPLDPPPATQAATEVAFRVLELLLASSAARYTKIAPIQFIVDGQHWVFDTTHPGCLFERGTHPRPALRLTMTTERLMSLLMPSTDATLLPDFVAEGDLGVLDELAGCFAEPMKPLSVHSLQLARGEM